MPPAPKHRDPSTPDSREPVRTLASPDSRQWALRLGAAGLLTLVGLLIGGILALLISVLAKRSDFSGALCVFGCAAVCCVAAFLYPEQAMEAVPAFAYFLAGLFVTAAAPEVIPVVGEKASKSEVLLFWFGVILAITMWLAFVLSYW